jgi:hypothetical protein
LTMLPSGHGLNKLLVGRARLGARPPPDN